MNFRSKLKMITSNALGFWFVAMFLTCQSYFGNDQENPNPSQLVKQGMDIESKNPQGAVELYKKAYFSGYPDNQISNRLKSGYRILIQSLIEKKEWDLAERMVDEVLKLPLEGVENFYAFKMQIASDSGNHNLAILYANQLASSTEPSNQTHYFKGKSFHKLKSFKLAIDSLTKITKDFAGYRGVKVLLGDSYYHRRQLQEAKASLQEAQNFKQTPDVDALLAKIETDMTMENDFMATEKPTYFSISAHKDELQAVQDRLVPILEGIYVDLAQTINFYPEIPIQVIVYEEGNRSWSSGLRNPKWAAGAYDGEIRIPGKELKAEDYELETLLRHELVHLFLDALTRHSIPTWFNEGLAQYYEKPFVYEGENSFMTREEAPLSKNQQSIATKALSTNQLLDVSELSGSFNQFNRDKAELAYAQSHLMVRYFMETEGQWKLVRMLREIFMGSPFEAAFEAQSGLSPAEFYLEWQVWQPKQWN